jgi:hypothetical protein
VILTGRRLSFLIRGQGRDRGRRFVDDGEDQDPAETRNSGARIVEQRRSVGRISRLSARSAQLRQKVELQAHEAKEIDFPVSEGNFAGLVMAAPISVSATLLDADGKIAGETKGGPDAMKDLFRTIGVDRQITKGVWKLRLENLVDQPATVFVGGYSGSAASGLTVEVSKPTAAGQIMLTAKWFNNSAPVLNAKITATVGGKTEPVTLVDDGKHGDGAADDGVNGAIVDKLSPGDHFVEAKAEANEMAGESLNWLYLRGTSHNFELRKAPG